MSQRLLTKSRFNIAMDCPNKLFYTKKKEYANKQLEDPFLEALAQGGFQVAPTGIMISWRSKNKRTAATGKCGDL